MSDSSEAHDRELEEIVAYLDGAISAEASMRIERQLASDEGFRQKLQSIERVWAALDELPLATVDDRFSRTTMQLAVQAAAAELQEKTVAMPVLQRRGRLSAIVATVVAAAIGFLAVRLARQDPNRMLLADLPVIQNLDVYSQFENADFLRLLARELGDRLQPLGGESTEVASRTRGIHAASVVGERTDWLLDLDDEQKIDLRAKLNRFRELPDDEKQRLRTLHEEIAAAADRTTLERTMFLYEDWLGGVPPALQFELRNMQPAERLRTIKARLEQMRDDASLTLTEPELRAFFREIRKFMPVEPRKSNDGDRDRDREREGPRRERPGGRQDEIRGPGYSQFQRMMAPQFDGGRPAVEFHAAVVAALPGRARHRFEELPPRDKFEQLMTWKRQALAMAGEISQQELEDFFAGEELDSLSREHLLSLPPGEMERSLKSRYRHHPQWGLPWWGPRGDGGPENRGPENRGPQNGRRPRGGGPGGDRDRLRPPGEFEGPGERRGPRPEGGPRSFGRPEDRGPQDPLPPDEVNS